jgi:N-acetylneuraminic acid mutarotase
MDNLLSASPLELKLLRQPNRTTLLALSLLNLIWSVGASPTVVGSPARQNGSSRTLTFADRVAYQYAIEEVYWRHRIWPKENAGPKPSLDGVMSPVQIEKKVADYLVASQLLTDQWQHPIDHEQLQAEMNRLGQHTQQPEVLAELFAAIGNDPFVIAECLARPILAARRILALGAYQNTQQFEGSTYGLETWRDIAADGVPYNLPKISASLNCADDSWSSTSTMNAPSARTGHTAIWTGTEMIVWGGSNLNSGSKYEPATDSWIPTSTMNAPSGRGGHTAIWTGSEMILWGGAHFDPFNGDVPFNTGGRYNPVTNNWIATDTMNAPDAREGHTAIWTGSEMVVWGGAGFSVGLNTGARYNPHTDSWIAINTFGAPAARLGHNAVWTGNEMIIWAGYDNNAFIYVNTGGRYQLSTDSWTATTLANAPAARSGHTGVWVGSEMIVWGGYNGSYLNSGSKYNPNLDTWIATSTLGAPTARESHTAAWTGNEMIIWGGYNGMEIGTGGRYAPAADSWIGVSTNNAPLARQSHTSVWTGSEMIIWGGYGGNALNTGGTYCAQPSTPIVQRVVSRKTHGGAGSFDVDLPLTGTPGIECRSGGATNDYTMVVTFLADVSVTGNPQAAVTSGIGMIGTGGVSNGGMVTISGNVVTIPLTSVIDAQTINVTLNGVNGSTNVTVPMSILVGDSNGNGSANASDVSQTKARVGQIVSASNFRSDVNANGSINASDVSAVKSRVGTGLP